jgi:hypothetical protein
MVMINAGLFFSTARERERIRQRRALGLPKPWTTDPSFLDGFFCNVHRERDTTTAWFRDNIRSKVFNEWAICACLIFRWFNREETAELIRDLLLAEIPWDEDLVWERLQDVRPLIGGAYIINTSGSPGESKLEGILTAIRLSLPIISKMEWTNWDRLEQAHEALMECWYLGRFMAYEVVTDLRWTNVLSHAIDKMTWASAGPGCARGLGRVVAEDPGKYSYGSRRDQAEMLSIMRDLLQMSREEEHWPQTWDPWEMREVEHWLCEFDKYERCCLGERLKRRYRGIN